MVTLSIKGYAIYSVFYSKLKTEIRSSLCVLIPFNYRKLVTAFVFGVSCVTLYPS